MTLSTFMSKQNQEAKQTTSIKNELEDAIN